MTVQVPLGIVTDSVAPKFGGCDAKDPTPGTF